jgi:flagellin
MSRTFLIALSLGLVAICSGHARANLVVDGGFEADTAGAAPNDPPWMSNDGVVIDNVFPHSGLQDAAMGNSPSTGGPGTLSQSLATVAGQDYILDFWVFDESANPADSFTASLGSFTLPVITGDMASSYTEFTATVPSADVGANATLSFIATAFPADWNLDDVSVTAAVPEPPAGALLGTALILWLGLVMPGRLRRSTPI